MSSNPTAVPKGQLTGQEILADLPALFDLAMTAQKSFQTPPNTAEGWALALGFAEGSMVHAACKALDTIHGGSLTPSQIAGLLGVVPTGPIGKTISLAETVIAQAAS